MRLMDALLKLTGKSINMDSRIPQSYVLGEIILRGVWLLRGLIRTRRRIFVGPGVNLRGNQFIWGRFCTVERYASINSYAVEGVSIGSRTKIGAYTVISATNSLLALGKGVKIGDDCGIGQFSFIGATGGVTVGNNVIMGQYVSFHASNHVFNDAQLDIREQGIIAKGIEIEDNVWVGTKATFLDGTKVGHGSVVAAGAVVSGEFPPRSIIGGVPAKVIRNLDSD